MRGLGRRQRALGAGKLHRRLEDRCLLDGAGLDKALVVELGKRRAHAVVPEAARVRGGRYEVRPERVHLLQRAHPARVAEVVGVLAARERRAACRLDRDEAVVALAAQLLAHERRDDAHQVRAAARAAYYDVGLHAVLAERRLRLEPDDRLVQTDLVQHRAKQIAGVRERERPLDGLGDRAAERAGRPGMLLVYALADLGRHRRRRRDVRAVGAHDVAAERLLLVGALNHVYVALEPEERRAHRERSAPLPGAGLGGDVGEALLLRVVRLRDGAVELVGARGVVALELVVYLGGRAERAFEEVRPDKRRRAVHLVEVAHCAGDRDELRRVVQLLPDALAAEDMLQLVLRAGLERRRVDQRRGLLLHVGADVVPRRREFVLGQVCLIWNLCVHV